MYTTTSRSRFAYIHLHIKRCQIQYFDEQQRTIADFNYFYTYTLVFKSSKI